MRYDIKSVIPEYIRHNDPKLVAFAEAYFNFLDQDGAPGKILNTLTEYRDIDKVSTVFIEYLQRELAVSIPETVVADKVKLYKNVTDIYLSKGAEPSFVALFNLIFNDNIELYFPRVDILKPSDGNWDASFQKWIGDDGKISHLKKLQDSRYYQSFSYVIKTGQTIENWNDAVKKLLHPAGFAFFGEVVIFTSASGKMPPIAPGRQVDAGAFVIIIDVVEAKVELPATSLIIDIDYVTAAPQPPLGPGFLHVDMYKFLPQTEVYSTPISVSQSRALAETYGEPLWCVGTGFRNTHLRATAPTVSNSKLAGNTSAGIEPWAANVFTEQSAKGTFIRKNNELKKALRKIGIDNKETWDKILEDGGSVQGLKQLDGWFYDGRGRLNQEEGESIKNVFKTFKEINQLELVRQAGIRQDYIDQSVSLNLAFPSEATPRWINQVHMEAWKRGIKTLYYMRTESVLRGDIAAAAMDPNCLSCDG